MVNWSVNHKLEYVTIKVNKLELNVSIWSYIKKFKKKQDEDWWNL